MIYYHYLQWNSLVSLGINEIKQEGFLQLVINNKIQNKYLVKEEELEELIKETNLIKFQPQVKQA